MILAELEGWPQTLSKIIDRRLPARRPPVNRASFNWRSGDGVLLKSTRLARSGHGYSTTLARWVWGELFQSIGSATRLAERRTVSRSKTQNRLQWFAKDAF